MAEGLSFSDDGEFDYQKDPRLIKKYGENPIERFDKIREQQEEESLKKYMPIGSVITLASSNQKYMIIGYNYFYESNIFDYISCVYPQGYSVDMKMQEFNHEQIKSVYKIGLISPEYRRAISEMQK